MNVVENAMPPKLPLFCWLVQVAATRIPLSSPTSLFGHAFATKRLNLGYDVQNREHSLCRQRQQG